MILLLCVYVINAKGQLFSVVHYRTQKRNYIFFTKHIRLTSSRAWLACRSYLCPEDSDVTTVLLFEQPVSDEISAIRGRDDAQSLSTPRTRSASKTVHGKLRNSTANATKLCDCLLRFPPGPLWARRNNAESSCGTSTTPKQYWSDEGEFNVWTRHTFHLMILGKLEFGGNRASRTKLISVFAPQRFLRNKNVSQKCSPLYW